MSEVAETASDGVTITVSFKGIDFAVDTSKITDMDTYQEIFAEGLKAIISRVGMSKIAAGLTKLSGKPLEEAKAKVVEQGQKTIQSMYDGNLKAAKGKTKVSGATQTEAMRLARALVKQTLKDNGYKVSAFDAKELTAFAKDVLADNPSLYKKAEENLAQRAAMPVKGLDVKSMLGAREGDETLKAKPKVPPTPRKKGEAVVAKAATDKVAPRAKPHSATAH